MPRKPFSRTLDVNTLKALKALSVRQDRPLNEILEEAAERYLAAKGAEDPDVQHFVKRAKEPPEDCLAVIERRIARVEWHRD